MKNVLVIAACMSLVAADDALADWPTYRADYARSAYAATKLPERPELLWRYDAPQPPSPAWPPPARGSYWQRLTSIEPRVVDDHAFHPVIANGLVFFGSSSDDSVRAIHLETGELKWTFTTDGPVRYAPAVHDNRVFFGSDDGCVYCLHALTGRELWHRRIGPLDRRLPGNGRMISAWPIRTGVAVDESAVFAYAGLFPSQGVFAAALDPKTGVPIWLQQIDRSPQGYLLLDKQSLFVPMGRANPSMYARSSGKFLGECAGAGGAFALIRDGALISGRGNDGQLTETDAATRKVLARFRGRQMAVGPQISYLLGEDKLVALDRRKRRDAAASKQSVLQAIQWTVEMQDSRALAACQNRIVVGGQNRVLLLNQADGQECLRFEVDGRALGLAISDKRCVVTTDRGGVYCFGSAKKRHQPAVVATSESPASDVNLRRRVVELLDHHFSPGSSVRTGYCVVLGADIPDLIDTLLTETKFKIVVLDRDLGEVEPLRKRLIAQGVYGSRVAVHVIEDRPLPFVDRFANLIVTSAALKAQNDDELDASDLLRLLRPWGGVAWLNADDPPIRKGPLPGAGKWTHLYGSPGNTADSGDEHLTNVLQLQWFGGPGPQLMTDRHLRAPAPLAADGRLIVPAENTFVCVDSFNGAEQWRFDAPHSQRYSVPYDCGYFSLDYDTLAIAVKEAAWLVNVNSGKLRKKLSLPERAAATDASVWGYLAMIDGRVFGSRQKAKAARSSPSRDLIDTDYRNSQPLVTSTSIFSIAANHDRSDWSYDGVIINPTICVTDQRVYFVESSDTSLKNHATGRIRLPVLLNRGAELVCLEASTGKILWKQQLSDHLSACSNILYVQATSDAVVVTGSLTKSNDTLYRLAVFDPASGQQRWQAEHFEGKPGAFTHGEQVHHPVVLRDKIVAEPAIYELTSGKRLNPNGQPGNWRLVRPGHSCGTLSGAGDCLFFRATNPTVLSLSTGLPSADRMQKLAPSRPGCWINIVPADGMVLIPEASASCVCLFSLQTSMAFAPVPSR